MTLNSNESRLFSGSEDKTIHIFDLGYKKEVGVLEGHTDRVKDLRVSADDTYLFSCSKDNTIKVWNINDLECIKTLNHHTNAVGTILLTSDQRFLVAGSADNSISVISLKDYKLVTTFKMIDGVNSIINVLNETYWYIIEKKNLYIMENPLTSATFSVLGPKKNKY